MKFLLDTNIISEIRKRDRLMPRPRSANASVVTMARVRNVPAMGVSRVSIGGQDYSIWRHSYRARSHDRL